MTVLAKKPHWTDRLPVKARGIAYGSGREEIFESRGPVLYWESAVHPMGMLWVLANAKEIPYDSPDHHTLVLAGLEMLEIAKPPNGPYHFEKAKLEPIERARSWALPKEQRRGRRPTRRMLQKATYTAQRSEGTQISWAVAYMVEATLREIRPPVTLVANGVHWLLSAMRRHGDPESLLAARECSNILRKHFPRLPRLPGKGKR